MINKNILNTCHTAGFSESDIYGAYKIFFSTLVSYPRLRIINLLRKGRKNVYEICSELKIGQTAISHNLARLRACGFVSSDVEGKFRYYRLNDKTIKPLINIIDEHMAQYCIHILHNLNDVAEKNG